MTARARGLLVPLLLGAAALAFGEGVVEEADRGNARSDVSYAFGMAVGSDLMQTGLEFNYSAFTRGLREMMEGETTRYTLDEAVTLVQTAYQEALAFQAEENRKAEEAFLAANAARPGVSTRESGLQYEELLEGTGARPGPEDTVLVYYEGSLADGTVFDSTIEGEPEEFPLDLVIPGWSEGLQLMREGGVSRLYIPSSQAYGAEGAGYDIPPYATLIFEVELLEVIPVDAASPENPEDGEGY